LSTARTSLAAALSGITADLDAAGQLTSPAGGSISVRPGHTARSPKPPCAACPLRERCTASSKGRSVSIHPDEALLAELRQRQQTPAGRAHLRERVQVEHALAHIGHRQGRRARYNSARPAWRPTMNRRAGADRRL